MSWHVDTLKKLLEGRLVVVAELAAERVRVDFTHIREVKPCGDNGFLFVAEDGTYTNMTPKNTWIDADRRSVQVEFDPTCHTTQRVFTVVNETPAPIAASPERYRRYEKGEAYQLWVKAEEDQGAHDH